uniref:Uncharacterized protein n=1 Tax=Anguilla anguilla TaxID=7936 RepID=A0A0E9XGN6_ANGAN
MLQQRRQCCRQGLRGNGIQRQWHLDQTQKGGTGSRVPLKP